MDGLNTCIERMVPNEGLRDISLNKTQIYKALEGRLF